MPLADGGTPPGFETFSLLRLCTDVVKSEVVMDNCFFLNFALDLCACRLPRDLFCFFFVVSFSVFSLVSSLSAIVV